MKNDYPIFFPNVVKTSTDSNNLLTDENVRFSEARKALFSLLRKGYFKKVIIVDGSNCELLTKEEIAHFLELNIEVEQLRFQQNVDNVKSFGKSNGEIQITNYMLAHSRLVRQYGGFYKISPRYHIENICHIFPIITKLTNVFYYYHPPIVRNYKSFVCTAFYKMSTDFYEEHFSDCIQDCGLEVGGYLESVFFRRLNGLEKRPINIEFPFFSGIGGTKGAPMKERFYFARNMLSKTGYIAYSF